MSEKTIKKRILLAQLHALEQEAFMKREIGNMYAQKNKMLDVRIMVSPDDTKLSRQRN